MPAAKERSLPFEIFLGFLIAHTLPFTIWAISSAVLAPLGPELYENRLYTPGNLLANLAIFSHMALGALLMIFVPLQFWPGLRRRFVSYHRAAGRLLCLGAVVTGVAGLLYIAARGTIGGFWMDLGFGLYGMLVVLSGGQVIRCARARDFDRHRRWALRLLVLTFGSWLYRVHYGVWYLLTGGLASTPAFDGIFDLVQNVAFYLPYLLLLEWWMRRGPLPA
ncbi:DUF2306 domain-containing protein [uncultured Roseobacter sp.]|uniref:DUF2306 domain-containing protein n=1 Tax=uncultured Roseobacter sp. TaxID=114847 RepID=UPI00260B2E5F|nr:DUF2306 domain-containing protein [uncultured Roseobacter sp.]